MLAPPRRPIGGRQCILLNPCSQPLVLCTRCTALAYQQGAGTSCGASCAPCLPEPGGRAGTPTTLPAQPPPGLACSGVRLSQRCKPMGRAPACTQRPAHQGGGGLQRLSPYFFATVERGGPVSCPYIARCSGTGGFGQLSGVEWAAGSVVCRSPAACKHPATLEKCWRPLTVCTSIELCTITGAWEAFDSEVCGPVTSSRAACRTSHAARHSQVAGSWLHDGVAQLEPQNQGSKGY